MPYFTRTLIKLSKEQYFKIERVRHIFDSKFDDNISSQEIFNLGLDYIYELIDKSEKINLLTFPEGESLELKLKTKKPSNSKKKPYFVSKPMITKKHISIPIIFSNELTLERLKKAKDELNARTN
jgi:hypothetical protein